MAEKNVFDITKLIFQNICVWPCGAAVRELLAPANELGSTLGDAISVSLYRFFLFSLCLFNPIFPFGLFFFILTADPAALGSIHILSFIPEIYFRKGTKLAHHKLF